MHRLTGVEAREALDRDRAKLDGGTEQGFKTGTNLDRPFLSCVLRMHGDLRERDPL